MVPTTRYGAPDAYWQSSVSDACRNSGPVMQTRPAPVGSGMEQLKREVHIILSCWPPAARQQLHQWNEHLSGLRDSAATLLNPRAGSAGNRPAPQCDGAVVGSLV